MNLSEDINMKNSNIGIAKEGFPIIFLLGLTSLVFALIGCAVVSLILLVLVWFSAYFFRDPNRIIPREEGLVTSPADGKIIKITESQDPFSGETRQCISVFMNVFNVHVNRSPVEGIINGIKYFEGTFMNAAYDKASADNERCAYSITDLNGDNFVFVQIAGLIARRIVCNVEVDDSLNRGERFGLIRFGSRVDLYLPTNYKPNVRIGEKVSAGQSVLAKKNQD